MSEYPTLANAGFVMPAGKARRAHEAASRGRRLGGWRATSAGPNQILEADLQTLRDRSRDAYRNNGWMRRGINSLVTAEIGRGINPRSRADDVALRDDMHDIWREFCLESDADGVLPFAGQLALACRTRRTAGEVFLRRRRRRLTDGLMVPLQIQVLEPDHVPIDLNRSRRNGNRIVHGIEFDRRGRRVAYWMYPEHPNEQSRGGISRTQPIRVPASEVLHHYFPVRPGQVRGEPDTVQAMVHSFVFDSYEDAELNRKASRSAWTGMIERPQYSEDDYLYDPFSGEPLKTDENGEPVVDVQSGEFMQLLPGEKPHLFDGDDSGDGYSDFMRHQLQRFAASMDLPYELFSGDYKNTQDRIYRAALNNFYRAIEADQDHLTIPQICVPVWRWVWDAAVLAGVIDVPDYSARRRMHQRAEWQPDAWPDLHPVQAVEASERKIKAGLSTRDNESQKFGNNAEDVDRENQIDNIRAGLHGVKYTTDTTYVPEEQE